MLCLMVCLLGVSCTNRRGPADNGLTNTEEDLLPVWVVEEGMHGLAAEEVSGDNHSVVIRQGLVLNVRVEVQGRWEVDEKAIRVTCAGAVHLPLIGSVTADGLTLNAFRDRVEQQYAEYYVNPRVAVDFVADEGRNTFPWGSVTVLGRVKNPGVVPLPPTQVLSVVAAIQAAGGLDTSADQRSIRVTGRNEQTRRVNLRELGRTGQSTENPLLQEGDVVYVPEQFF